MYIGAIPLIPYYGYLTLFHPEMLTALRSLPAQFSSLSTVPNSFMTNVLPGVRAMSVIAALLVLSVAFLVGRKVLGEEAALVGTLLTATSPLFLPHARFATVEIYLALFLWLSFLFQQGYLENASRRDIFLSAVCVGLALASKYTAIFGAMFMFLTWLAGPRHHRHLRSLILLIAIIGFVGLLANPWPVLSFRKVLNTTMSHHHLEVWGKGARTDDWTPEVTPKRGWIAHAMTLVAALPITTLLPALAGLATILLMLLKGRSRRDSIWLLRAHLVAWPLFYYFLSIGPWTTTPSRFLIPLVPSLGLLAGWFIVKVASLLRARWLKAALYGGVMAMAVFIASAVIMAFVHDTRYAATDWLELHVPRGASIGYLSHQPPYLPEFPERTEPVYIGFIRNLAVTGTEFQKEADGLSISGPDYLVLTSLFYNRFLEGKNERTRFYETLLSGAHPGYQEVGRFEQRALLGFRPRIDFASPTIVILRRVDGTDAQAG